MDTESPEINTADRTTEPTSSSVPRPPIPMNRKQRRKTMAAKVNHAQRVIDITKQVMTNNQVLLHFIDDISTLVGVPMDEEMKKNETTFFTNVLARVTKLVSIEMDYLKSVDIVQKELKGYDAEETIVDPLDVAEEG